MNTDDSNTFEPAHLRAWLETTRHYLFAGQADCANATACVPHLPGLDSHGARDRFVSRVRGRLLRLTKYTVQRDRNPLWELERAFKIQAVFIACHPEIPGRLLGWLSQGRDSRMHRRIRKLIGHYESRISRLIARARQQGSVKADIDPQAAASVFIGMIQSLALRVNLNLSQRERLPREALDHFSLFRAAMTAASR